MKEEFAAELNRAQRRAINLAAPQRSDAIKITRHNGSILVGIEKPGYVKLTDLEAAQLANSLLDLVERSIFGVKTEGNVPATDLDGEIFTD